MNKISFLLEKIDVISSHAFKSALTLKYYVFM